MAHASRYGYIKVPILCHRRGATNIEWATLCAEERGTKKSCKCVTSGPILTQIDRANVRQFGVHAYVVTGSLSEQTCQHHYQPYIADNSFYLSWLWSWWQWLTPRFTICFHGLLCIHGLGGRCQNTQCRVERLVTDIA